MLRVKLGVRGIRALIDLNSKAIDAYKVKTVFYFSIAGFCVRLCNK